MNFNWLKRFFSLLIVIILVLIIIATVVVALLGDKVDKNITYGLISTMIFLPAFMYLLSMCYRFFDQRNKKIIEDNIEQNNNLNKKDMSNANNKTE